MLQEDLQKASRSLLEAFKKNTCSDNGARRELWNSYWLVPVFAEGRFENQKLNQTGLCNLFAVRWNTSPVEHQSVDFFWVFDLERFAWNTSQLGIIKLLPEKLIEVFQLNFLETCAVVCISKKHIRKVPNLDCNVFIPLKFRTTANTLW